MSNAQKEEKISEKILKILEAKKIKFKPLFHKVVYTAKDAAATLKVKPETVAKVVHVVADRTRQILLVLPATHQVNLAKLKKALKIKEAALSSEKKMMQALKIKKGTLVPFADFYKNVEIYVDKILAKGQKVIVPAGKFTQSLELKTKDFLKLAGEKLIAFAEKKKVK